MVWVRSEYAGELAVLATWLSGLLPWSASFIRIPPAQFGHPVTVINIRFLFIQFHYQFGVAFAKQQVGQLVQLVPRIPNFVPTDQRLEGWIWVAAAGLYLGLLVLSFLYYAREDAVTERLPVDPVRVFGVGLGLVAAALSVSFWLFRVHQRTIPIGVIFLWVFAVLLVRVERT